MENHSLCSVSRYIIKHQIPGKPFWEEYVDHGTTWSFPWIEPTHTVTILAMNSVGISAINSNLTLSQQMSTGKSSNEWDVENARNPCDVHRESSPWDKIPSGRRRNVLWGYIQQQQSCWKTEISIMKILMIFGLGNELSASGLSSLH